MESKKDVILNQLAMSEFLYTKLTADLSDEEYFKAPVAGGNHVAWCLGHMAVSEDRLSAAATGTKPQTSEATQELFKGGSKCHPDASKYPSRAEIDALFRDNHAHIIEKLKAFDESKWNDPAPEGVKSEVLPTLGAIWSLTGIHPFWHVGHITVCRVALGKGYVLG